VNNCVDHGLIKCDRRQLWLIDESAVGSPSLVGLEEAGILNESSEVPQLRADWSGKLAIECRQWPTRSL
jgi:hypothetical protein